MKKEITWKTGNGAEVVFLVELQTERVIGTDDIAGEVKKPCCEIKYSATAAGHDVGGLGWLQEVEPQKVGNVTVVAGLGKLGISEENYARIKDAIKEIKDGDYWQNWQKKEEAAAKLDQEYEAHVERVDRMMNP